jgi:hypothetical protein
LHLADAGLRRSDAGLQRGIGIRRRCRDESRHGTQECVRHGTQS